MANELGELIKSRKKNYMLNVAVSIATDEMKRLQQENAELREAFKELKSIAMQEREWRLEDLEVGHCEAQESMDTLSYRIDKLLNKND